MKSGWKRAWHISYFRVGDAAGAVEEFVDEHKVEILTDTRETFVSPTRGFSESYEGVLVRLTARGGTTAALENIGVRNVSAATAARYPNMPLVARGWGSTSALFKGEGRNHVNIGLGGGRALDMFNDAIVGFERVG